MPNPHCPIRHTVPGLLLFVVLALVGLALAPLNGARLAAQQQTEEPSAGTGTPQQPQPQPQGGDGAQNEPRPENGADGENGGDGDRQDGDSQGENEDEADGDGDGEEEADGDRPRTAREILDYIDDLHRADSSRGRMRMAIKKTGWQRTLEMEYWTKGREQSLFRVTAPARERGMATLRSGNDIWNYLPRTDRTIRLSSAMMGDSWAGSHFTNNDLVRESRMAEDYEFEITFQGERRGYEIIEITCIPKPDAAVEWGKVVVTVRAENYLPMFAVYHDEDLEPARYLTYHDVREFDGRRVPSVMRVIPADARNESTTLTVLAARYNIEIDDDVFSLRNLRR